MHQIAFTITDLATVSERRPRTNETERFSDSAQRIMHSHIWQTCAPRIPLIRQLRIC